MLIEQISSLEFRLFKPAAKGPRDVCESLPWQVGQKFMLGSVMVRQEEEDPASWIVTLEFTPLKNDQPYMAGMLEQTQERTP